MERKKFQTSGGGEVGSCSVGGGLGAGISRGVNCGVYIEMLQLLLLCYIRWASNICLLLDEVGLASILITSTNKPPITTTP